MNAKVGNTKIDQEQDRAGRPLEGRGRVKAEEEEVVGATLSLMKWMIYWKRW